MSFWLSRLLRLLAVLFAVTFLTFTFVSLLPGDTVDAMLGANASAEDRAAAREELNLDQPIVVRYFNWLGDAVTGDLGVSYRTGQPVSDAIRERLPITIQLVLMSQIIALLVAVPIAIFGALRPGGTVDKGMSALSLVMLATPGYLFALLLMATLAVRLGWFPTTGFVPFRDDPVENLKSLFLPALALGLETVPMYARVLRTDLVNTFDENFIWFARAKGNSTGRIVRKHAMRPASIGIVTLSGITMGRMIGGAVLIETIFALPGIGRYTIDSVNNRDFMALQGAVVIATVGFVVVNFIVDILHGVIDPRIKTQVAT